jgi:hypothetical protein
MVYTFIILVSLVCAKNVHQFSNVINSLGMGSIVAKTGCKMPLFRLGDLLN